MKYDVVIIGGGPTGLALAIELGMNNVNTLVLEKHKELSMLPRAQSLNARTMELLMRFGIDKELEDSALMESNLPVIWCNDLTHKPYFMELWGENRLTQMQSSKSGLRIPLWITESILYKKLKTLPSVHIELEQDVVDIKVSNDEIKVYTKNAKNSQECYSGKFIACCDGVNGNSKRIFNNRYVNLTEKTKVLSVSFTSMDIVNHLYNPNALFYIVSSNRVTAFIGMINPTENSWFAQIICDSSMPQTMTTEFLEQLIDLIVGYKIKKQITNHHFWDMQVSILNNFSVDNRIFWLGDSAHSFAPTGGMGVNTAFGDAVNLGWKLAATIKDKASNDLLVTYNIERKSVAIANQSLAKEAAKDALELKNNLQNLENSTLHNKYSKIGSKMLNSTELTMGYAYLDSPLTNQTQQKTTKTSKYLPKAEPGYFLPHAIANGQPIYRSLSPVEWTLVICGKVFDENNQDNAEELFGNNSVQLLRIPESVYPYRYILIRPDWHIARVGDYLDEVRGPLYK